MVVHSEYFDQALIKLARWLVANFLLYNSDFSINEIPITDAIMAEEMNVEEYMNNIVLCMGEDAKNLILYIMPIVLRINIKLVLMDLGKEVAHNYIETIPSRVPYISYTTDDSLNLHDETICILLKPGHYDALYEDEYISNNNILLANPMPSRVAHTERIPIEFLNNQLHLSKSNYERTTVSGALNKDYLYTDCCNKHFEMQKYKEEIERFLPKVDFFRPNICTLLYIYIYIAPPFEIAHPFCFDCEKRISDKNLETLYGKKEVKKMSEKYKMEKQDKIKTICCRKRKSVGKYRKELEKENEERYYFSIEKDSEYKLTLGKCTCGKMLNMGILQTLYPTNKLNDWKHDHVSFIVLQGPGDSNYIHKRTDDSGQKLDRTFALSSFAYDAGYNDPDSRRSTTRLNLEYNTFDFITESSWREKTISSLSNKYLVSTRPTVTFQVERKKIEQPANRCCCRIL